MRRNTFLLAIILLVTAAGAAVTYALTVPSIGKKSLKAYFVSPDIYESRISGHRQEVLDPDALRFEGERVPYDAETNTVYIPQSLRSEEWEGSLIPHSADLRKKLYGRESGIYRTACCHDHL